MLEPARDLRRACARQLRERRSVVDILLLAPVCPGHTGQRLWSCAEDVCSVLTHGPQWEVGALGRVVRASSLRPSSGARQPVGKTQVAKTRTPRPQPANTHPPPQAEVPPRRRPVPREDVCCDTPSREPAHTTRVGGKSVAQPSVPRALHTMVLHQSLQVV